MRDEDKRNVEHLKVDDSVLAAMKKAKAESHVIDTAKEVGIIHRAEGQGWTMAGYRGDIFTKAQERAFDKARFAANG